MRRSRSGNACMDFMMMSVLRSERHAGLAEHEARFYAACALLGLQQLHEAGYVHRDIKVGVGWGWGGGGRVCSGTAWCRGERGGKGTGKVWVGRDGRGWGEGGELGTGGAGGPPMLNRRDGPHTISICAQPAATALVGIIAPHAEHYSHALPAAAAYPPCATLLTPQPSNCLFAECGYLKLSDLGLAKRLEGGAKAHSQVGSLRVGWGGRERGCWTDERDGGCGGVPRGVVGGDAGGGG